MNTKNDTIEKIKRLLDQLENDLSSEEESLFLKNFNALELPSIISSIVDFLQPSLLPYEATFYWYLFKNSIISTGQQYLRVSNSKLRTDVVKPSSGSRNQSGKIADKIAESTIRKTLLSLQDKNILVCVGDTNREGTLYKICIPDEIPLCQEMMRSQSINETLPVDLKHELDYYNVPENRLKVFERDEYKCHYCKKQLTRFSATLDHIQPVSKGGDNSIDNLVTSCLHCNSERGNRPIMDMIAKERKS